jgi:hypothetical protein
VFVDDAECDVILKLESSNNPAKYQSGTHYLIEWDDIADFQNLTDARLAETTMPHL